MSQKTTQPSQLAAMEEGELAIWKKERVFERSIAERSEDKSYVFYDGPPFATGLPHYGHLLQSTIKDAVPRYWTMRGYRIPRRWGWDCHGLPIENLIEKELKLKSKRDIETLGIDKFIDACRTSVMTYEREWEKYVDRIGRWVDFKNSYKTMDNDYIESIWWVFAELHKNNYVYKGLRTSLYCPRCATPLSNFEIAMDNSFVDQEDPAIFVKFPSADDAKTFYVAWTTTPWSLPGNTGLTVHPDLIYVAAHLESTDETLIFAEARQTEVLKQWYPLQGETAFRIVGRWTGRELAGKRYLPLYPEIKVDGDAFRVVVGMHVSADDGSGIVHTAPAFGEEDLMMHREHGLPILQTTDEEGRLTSDVSFVAGLNRHAANQPLIDDLHKRGLLLRAETIMHSVPACYRCHTLLLYRAQPAWFVDITKLKPKLLKTAAKINWYPEHIKTGRFGHGLATAPDWNISRSRYWGSPMPVWECTACGERTIIASVAELKERAINPAIIDTLDLHRPMIDNVELKCQCGKSQQRIPEVFDCWFESGSMPVASLHYPFENKRWFEKNFPADFIAEAQDQTRGWFYTLHVIATALFNKPAFQNVIVTGMVLAEDGRKMSKSLKNYPDPWNLFSTYGADAVRYYLLSSPVVNADSLNFAERDVQTIVRGFLNLLWNVKVFYETYAPSRVALTKPRSAHILDRWLFSRLMQTLSQITTSMDGYQLMAATRPLQDLVNDLSTWWLRRSRERLKTDNEFERADACKTLREALELIATTMAPFTPFIADRVYRDIGGQMTSVHLEKWPKVETNVIDDKLLQDMQWLRDVCSQAHERRAEAKLPVRQTLASVTVQLANPADVQRLNQQTDLLMLMREELNVESIILQTGTDKVPAVILDTMMTPELLAKGWRRELVRQVMIMRKAKQLSPTDNIHLQLLLPDGPVKEAVFSSRDALQRDVRAASLTEVAVWPADQTITRAAIGGVTVEMMIVC